MKERLMTLLLAAGALLLFYELMFPKPGPVIEEGSEPISTDAGPNGELALWKWLHSEQVPVASLRYRYDQLVSGKQAVTGAGNILLTALPHKVAVRGDEVSPLVQWLRRGNTIVVLAALDDTPGWSIARSGSLFLSELKTLTGMEFTAPKDEKPRANDLQTPPDSSGAGATDLRSRMRNILTVPDLTLEPTTDEQPLLSGVHRVHGASEFPASKWQLSDTGDTAFELLRRTDSGAPALWLKRLGQGQIFVMSLTSPFGNGQIDRDDNARLLSNIIAWSRSADGQVVFDDVHQGLAAYYDARAFYADPRLHRTLGWIVLLWLVFVLGPLPLRSAWRAWQPVDETALIDASSRFYSVAVPALEAAHRLFENFFNQLRGKLNLPENGAPLWEWLGSQSAVSTQERERLQALYAQVHAGARLKLTSLQALLSDIQRKVA